MAKSVLMLLRNEFEKDIRVIKMVDTIRNSGASVTVLSFVSDMPRFKTRRSKDGDNLDVLHYRSGVSFANRFIGCHSRMFHPRISLDKTALAFFYLLFLNAKFVFNGIMNIRHKPYDVIHANDLDTLPAAYILSLFCRADLVYDSHEIFSELYSDYTYLLKELLTSLEAYLVAKCDHVFTVNDQIAQLFADRYGAIPAVVMNCPVYSKVNRGGDGKFKVIYIGVYQEERGIEPLIKSTVFWIGGDLYLMGWGPIEYKLREIAQEWNCDEMCHFLEPVKADAVVGSLIQFDAGIIPYPPSLGLNKQYASPNKMFEYMMAGVVPLVPHGSVVLESIADEIGISIRFRAGDAMSISQAVNELHMDHRYWEYQSKCLELARTKYNWEVQSLPVIDYYAEQRPESII